MEDTTNAAALEEVNASEACGAAEPSAEAPPAPVERAPSVDAGGDKIVLHVRFAPDGSVFEIGDRPAALTAQKWFDLLCDKFGTKYEALSGGRGVFRLTRELVAETKAAAQ